MPVVLAIAQGGKQAFLSKRAELLSQLLPHAAVCLVDVRGTGETKTDSDRGRRSEDTDLAASELMLGSTLLVARLRDVRTTLAYLRTRPEFGKVAVLGEALQKVNGPDVVVNRPLDLDQPAQAEPLGPLLALLASLFEPQPLVVATRGGLIDYHSLLESPFIHLPLDVIVPGAAASADLPLVAAAVGRHNPLWIGGLVDGRNQAASTKQVAERYGDQAQTMDSDQDLAKWLIGELKKP